MHEYRADEILLFGGDFNIRNGKFLQAFLKVGVRFPGGGLQDVRLFLRNPAVGCQLVDFLLDEGGSARCVGNVKNGADRFVNCCNFFRSETAASAHRPNAKDKGEEES